MQLKRKVLGGRVVAFREMREGGVWLERGKVGGKRGKV